MNSWSCLLDSFAFAFSISPYKLLDIIGHDGAEIIWPGLPDPLCRRSFHPQEFVRAGLLLDYAVIGLEKETYQVPVDYLQPYKTEYIISEYLQRYNGVLTGTCLTRNVRHAICWQNCVIYDPATICSKIEQFNIETFWVVKKIG